jgi:arylsulfatase A-like enzyme
MLLRLTRLLVLVLGLALPGCGKSPVSAEQVQPNILLILADDAGFADFGFQGPTDLETPNLDRLGAEGIRFTDAHVSATVCSPSRAGLLTGRYQQRFGHEGNLPPKALGMDITQATLASVLKEAGYRTGLFGKWHLGEGEEYHPNERGFEEFYGFLGGSRSYFSHPGDDQPGRPRAMMHNQDHVTFDGYLTDVLAERTIEFISSVGEKPFFAFLSFNAVHTPMEAMEDDLARFEGHPRQTLAAMTWAMDRAAGTVLDYLDKEGLTQDTLIFFLSDNGGALPNQSSNAPLKGWKGNKFEGGHRIPFVVKWEDHLPAGTTFTGLTSTMDSFPTSMAAAGIERKAEQALDGRNLFPYLQSDLQGDPHDILFFRKEDEAAVRKGDLKLIRLDDYGHVLYDLSEDLGEESDLKNKLPVEFAEMKAALQTWESELAQPWWHEPEEWLEVTWEIHKALMENKQPERVHP